MWRGIFTDLLMTVGIFVVAFFIGRGTWPARYRGMKRRWSDARAESKHLRAQLEEVHKQLPQVDSEGGWDGEVSEHNRRETDPVAE